MLSKGPRFPYPGYLKSTDAIPEQFGSVKDKKKEDGAALVKNGERTNREENAIAEKDGAAPAH